MRKIILRNNDRNYFITGLASLVNSSDDVILRISDVRGLVSDLKMDYNYSYELEIPTQYYINLSGNELNFTKNKQFKEDIHLAVKELIKSELAHSIIDKVYYYGEFDYHNTQKYRREFCY